MFERLEHTLRLTLFTEAFVVQGTVRVIRPRLSDVLNDAEHEFVVLHDVVLNESGSTGSEVRAAFAQVNFGAILFVVADERLEPTPEMRVEKVAEPALISIPPFTLIGRIHLRPDPSFDVRLGQLTARFFPVTDVTYWSDRPDEPRRTAPMVAVNRRRAQILAPYAEPVGGSGVAEG
ncbi:MAG: hypothetical protein ACHQ01_08080 [Candidatus Limnocylindrales bacterium]